ncbi:hypothetical protein H8356DRAFT_1340955 [Neocallimastix lanati (nom. inval.)]|nr:hypothetical protein H8356DRAFT_1340949 [Neocallimastix sp. JGI-2020a]KAG4089399.1 hypothetical protein H8356DRAFT_1322157 [Neocallimastix sp. JGI-2020a]KAG4095063.1 hypothetical protein H8356DRAFT_1340955 [Neocallimastix sp. JGI-2020a]
MIIKTIINTNDFIRECHQAMVSSLHYIDKNSDRIKFHYLKDILRMESMMVNEILATVIKKVLNPIQLVLFRQGVVVMKLIFLDVHHLCTMLCSHQIR